MSDQPVGVSDQVDKMNIDNLTQISIRRFSFFMKFIAENNLWDEAELYLEDHGCQEIVVSSEPIAAIQNLVKEKSAGEPVNKRGLRVMASITCGGGHPTPPPKPPPTFPPPQPPKPPPQPPP